MNCPHCDRSLRPLESTVTNVSSPTRWPWVCGALGCITRLTGQTWSGPEPDRQQPAPAVQTRWLAAVLQPAV